MNDRLVEKARQNPELTLAYTLYLINKNYKNYKEAVRRGVMYPNCYRHSHFDLCEPCPKCKEAADGATDA